MTLRIYDTAARAKRVFEPQDPARVTLYVCGPTVYNYAHIGNARMAVVNDLLVNLSLSFFIFKSSIRIYNKIYFIIT